jgi:hypothetical protein
MKITTAKQITDIQFEIRVVRLALNLAAFAAGFILILAIF